MAGLRRLDSSVGTAELCKLEDPVFESQYWKQLYLLFKTSGLALRLTILPFNEYRFFFCHGVKRPEYDVDP